MVISFDEFTEILDEAVNRIPPQYCKNLTGGFNVEQKQKRDQGFYVLGEYVEGSYFGCFIVFYYGSFLGLLGDRPREIWEAEILDTVFHEMQHHLESKAGRDDLARQEIQDLARYMGR